MTKKIDSLYIEGSLLEGLQITKHMLDSVWQIDVQSLIDQINNGDITLQEVFEEILPVVEASSGNIHNMIEWLIAMEKQMNESKQLH